jgi:hypothetical protein
LTRRKTPQEKKEEEYKYEIRPWCEAPHAFRKNWPRKKARVNRAERRDVKQTIGQDLSSGNEDDLTLKKLKTIHVPSAIRKTHIMTLRQRLQNKKKLS